jgi:guanine deaminase
MNEKTVYMSLAIKEAMKGVKAGHGGPFGAVIVRKRKIISHAHNMVVKLNDPTAHAEVLAIRIACEKLKRFSLHDCDIYSTCEPCPMCFSAIQWARIPNLFYGATRSDAEKIGFDDKLLYAMLMGEKTRAGFKIKKFYRTQCLKAFRYWEEKIDKVPY